MVRPVVAWTRRGEGVEVRYSARSLVRGVPAERCSFGRRPPLPRELALDGRDARLQELQKQLVGFLRLALIAVDGLADRQSIENGKEQAG